MSIAEFSALVAFMCNFSVAGVSKDYKIRCSEFFVNCVVDEAGNIPAEKLKKCKMHFEDLKGQRNKDVFYGSDRQ